MLMISRELATRLLGAAQADPQREVCGLIGGRDGQPVNMYPVANVAADPTRSFELDPQGQIAARRTLRERGETLLAVYHSHPDAPPEPSTRDLERSGEPQALMLIISLNTKGVLEMRAFRPGDGRVEEVPLQVFF